jgi:hypothetical protein
MSRFKKGIALAVSLLAVALGVASPAQAKVPDWDAAPAATFVQTPPGKITFDPVQVARVEQATRAGTRPSPFGKDGKRLVPPSPFLGAGWYHAGAQMVLGGTDFARGMSVTASVHTQYADPGASMTTGYSHSIFEMAVTESSTAKNSVEYGWANEKSAFGDNKPRLFAASWRGGTWNGCYDGHDPSCLWIDNTSATPNLGDDLSAVAGTAYPNNSIKLQMFWSATNCGPAASGWFLVYSTGAGTPTTIGCFTPNAVNSMSNIKIMQPFGEYYYNGTNYAGTSNDKPLGDMGNGQYPASSISSTGPAWMASLGLINPSPSTLTAFFTRTTPEDAAAYDITAVGTSGRNFTYGGGGYKLSGGVMVTPGNVGP